MLFKSAAHPGKSVRLAYCMNLHAAETLGELLENMRRITLPLRERLAKDREFGVGMYLPAVLARELSNHPAKLAELKRFLDQHALDPFTYNAFPYGGFQTDGLKERVFEPTWTEQARFDFTLDVAIVAAQLRSREGGDSHISISTHAGMHGSQLGRDPRATRERCALSMVTTASALSQFESSTGKYIILSIEPEPRSSCNDTRELNELNLGAVRPEWQRHLGVCLDTCHSAVEFESERGALMRAAQLGAGIGKMQFSSALSVRNANANAAAVAQLFALDEPRFLHQVTGRHADGAFMRAGDLPDAQSAWESGGWAWRECEELRCHFHVPVDVERLDAGLSTTRAHADALLELVLGDRLEWWHRPELHVEIETYTWDVLPRAARGAGELVDGLEREYRHVIAQLERAGWRMA